MPGLAIHNSECNDFYFKFKDCEKENPIKNIFGHCSPLLNELQKCIAKQREIQKARNYKESERRRKILLESNHQSNDKNTT